MGSLGRWPTLNELGLDADAVHAQVSCALDDRLAHVWIREILVQAHIKKLSMGLPIRQW